MAKKNNTLPVGYIEVTRDKYHVRASAFTGDESYGTVKKGDRIPYLGKADKGWYKVRFENKIGWLYSGAGKAIEVAQNYLKIKKGDWNVRSGANGKTKSLGIVSGGMKVLDQGETKNHYRLIIFENQNAWIPERAIEKE